MKTAFIAVLVSISMAGTLPLTGEALSSHPASREYVLKAAFLYNFAKFVEWPKEAFDKRNAPLSVCILGDDPFGAALDTIEGKTADRHPIEISRLTPDQSSYDCHMLFISRSESAQLGEHIKKAPAHSLIVSDIQGFAQRGGMIGLQTEDNRIRFAINLDATTTSRLKVSSRLLRLATEVVHVQRAQN